MAAGRRGSPRPSLPSLLGAWQGGQNRAEGADTPLALVPKWWVVTCQRVMGRW